MLLASQSFNGHLAPMNPHHLKADCSKCHALCCVALAFDKSAMFAIDKPAGVACPNLDQDFKCSTHDTLQNQGFQGCINYDCSGAGQRVCQQIFPDQNWHDQPAILIPMLSAFQNMRLIQEHLVLLGATKSLGLSKDQLVQVSTFEARLQDDNEWQGENLELFALNPLNKAIQSFLKSLAPLVGQRSAETDGAP